MLRKLQLLLVLVLVAATTETGVRASTDCERWIASSKAELAHTKALKRLAAAKAWVKRLAQHKLATYVKKPTHPTPMRTHFVRPKYTRQQMLDRFNVLCGDLPGMKKPTESEKLLDGEMTPIEFASEMTPFVPVELGGPGSGDGLVATNEVPPYSPPGTEVPSGGSPFGGGGGPPFLGGPVGKTPPGTPVPPVVGEAPEPGSIVLMLTGIAGAAGMVRRRILG
jgi:hypothetical protein